MKALIAILVVAVCLSSEAQLAVYKEKTISTTTGAGLVTRYAFSGWVVMDLSSQRIVRLAVLKAQSKFKVMPMDDLVTDTISGAGKSYTVITKGTSEDVGTIKGVNALLDLGDSPSSGGAIQHSLPKTMAVSFRSIYTENNSRILEEVTGSLTIDLKESQAANLTKSTLDQEIEKLKLSLVGYTEVQ